MSSRIRQTTMGKETNMRYAMMGLIVMLLAVSPCAAQRPAQTPRPPQAPPLRGVTAPAATAEPINCPCGAGCTCGCAETGVCHCGDKAAGRPAILVVMLPARARLLVDGRLTKSTGPVRRLESDPITESGSFTLRASFGGRAVTVQAIVHPGRTTYVTMPLASYDVTAVYRPAPAPMRMPMFGMGGFGGGMGGMGGGGRGCSGGG